MSMVFLWRTAGSWECDIKLAVLDRLNNSARASHLREGDGVEIDHAEYLLVWLHAGVAGRLHALSPAADGAEVIAEMEGTRGLNAREGALDKRCRHHCTSPNGPNSQRPSSRRLRMRHVRI